MRLPILFLLAIGAVFSNAVADVAESRKNPSAPKIGVLLPLSGPLAAMGKSVKRGFDLFVQDHPSAKDLFVFEDHKYDGKTTVTALHALRARGDVQFTAIWGNTPSSAAAPVAEQQRIPTLTLSENPDAKDRRFVVSMGPTVHHGVGVFVEHLRSVNAKHAAAVTVDIGNAIETIDLIDKQLSGGIIKKIVATEEVDFKPLISQLKTKSVDALVLFLLPQQALSFLKQAKQLNFLPEIVGGDIFAEESFRQEAQKLSDKIAIVYGGVPQAFIDRLNKTPDGSSYFFEVATGYALATMADRLLTKWRTTDGTDNPLTHVAQVDLSDIPYDSIQYRDDTYFGRHFEIALKVY